MSERIEKAIAANKETPHLNNHEIVLELGLLMDEVSELNKKIIGLQKAIEVLLSDRQAEKE